MCEEKPKAWKPSNRIWQFSRALTQTAARDITSVCVYVFWGIIWQSFVCVHVCVLFLAGCSLVITKYHSMMSLTQGGSPGSVSRVHVGEAYFLLSVKVVGGEGKTIE